MWPCRDETGACSLSGLCSKGAHTCLSPKVPGGDVLATWATRQEEGQSMHRSEAMFNPRWGSHVAAPALGVREPWVAAPHWGQKLWAQRAGGLERKRPSSLREFQRTPAR